MTSFREYLIDLTGDKIADDEDLTLVFCAAIIGISGEDDQCGTTDGGIWHVLIERAETDTESTWPDMDVAAIIYREDNCGFRSYDTYTSSADAETDWQTFKLDETICGVCGSNYGEWHTKADCYVCQDCAETL